MARKALIVKAQRQKKFKVREYNRCPICGRARAFYRKFNMCRKDFFNVLKRKGILCQVHYIPVYRQPYYGKKMTGRSGEFKNSDTYYERAVSIPMYPAMNDSDVRDVVTGIKDLLKAG